MRLVTRGAWLGIFLLAGLAAAPAQAAQEQSRQVRVRVDVARIRSSPSLTTARNIIASAPRGTVLEALRRETDWFLVRLTPSLGTRAETGFIHVSVVEVLAYQAPSAARVEPVEGRARPEPPPTPEPASAAPQKPASPKTAGRWGLGLNVQAVSFGWSPAVQFNLHERVAIEGTLGLYTGVTALGGQVWYRFPGSASNPAAAVKFEPVAGGGLHLVTVDAGLTSESLVGFSASGGAFMHLRDNPHWRFKGTLNFVQFNYERAAFRGFGTSLAAFYFF